MVALTEDLSIDSEIAHVDMTLVAGTRYTIGSEVIRANHALIETWDDVTTGLRWYVDRAEDHTAAAAHSSGATLTVARAYAAGGEPGDTNVYVQSTDPGAVGAGKLWVDTTSIEPRRILIRSTDDDQWFDFFENYAASGAVEIITTENPLTLTRKDSEGQIRSQLIIGPSGVTMTTTNEDGLVISAQEIGYTGNLLDEAGTVRVAYAAVSGASDDADAGNSTTILDADGLIKSKISQNETGLHFEGANVVEVPATPDAQDIVDALLALGLVTQAS